MICNNESADHLSLVLLLDEASQAAMGSVVRAFEEAIEVGGGGGGGGNAVWRQGFGGWQRKSENAYRAWRVMEHPHPSIACQRAGVPISRPRSLQEPFHSTLGVVEAGYPLVDALAAINGNISGADPLGCSGKR